MSSFFSKLHRDERGDVVQFILIAAAVAVPLIVAMIAFGDDIVNYLENQAPEVDEGHPEYEGQLG